MASTLPQLSTHAGLSHPASTCTVKQCNQQVLPSCRCVCLWCVSVRQTQTVAVEEGAVTLSEM